MSPHILKFRHLLWRKIESLISSVENSLDVTSKQINTTVTLNNWVN